MIAGVGFYSYTIGNMTSIIQETDAENEELQNLESTLKSFASQNKLPNSLVKRISRHLENA